MKNRIYLIKNISPWMINELLAFSQFTTFRLILLRKPPEVFKEDLAILERKGIKIYIKPFQKFPSVKKILFAFWFLAQNLFRFWGLKNFVFGIKSIYWFIMLRENIIQENSSLHAQFATQASIIALLYKHYLHNVEYSFTFHAHDIYYPNSWFRLLVNESKKAISISEYNINYVENHYGKNNIEKIMLSRLGVFIPDIRTNNKRNTFTIGFLSWWDEKKGLMLLLQAFNVIIYDYNLPLKLILAGDGPIRTKVEKFILDNSLQQSINNRGKLFGKDKEQFYADIDVFILPSINTQNDMDGIPVVLMEAVSYGVPIISTNISGIPEICKNNYNGFLIPPNDVNALMEAILKFYNMDDVHFQQFKHRAYESSRDYYIIENSKNKLEKLGWIKSQE